MNKYFTILAISVLSFAFTTVNNWEIFQYEKGNFRIEMPDLPTVSTQLLSSKIGDLEMHIFMHEGEAGIDDNILYMLNYTDYPETVVNADDMDEAAMKEFFTNSINGAVNNMDGELKAKKEIEVLGKPGREVTISYLNGDAIMRMQIILVKNRMYTLQTVSLAANDDNEAQKRFFNSLEFIK
jgi:hypothetical protein